MNNGQNRIHDLGHSSSKESGVALILVLTVLVALTALIGGMSRDVSMDLGITRNLREQNDVFNWTEAGLDVTEEMIAYAADSRGEDANSSIDISFAGSNYTVSNPGSTLFLSSGNVDFNRENESIANSNVKFLGREQAKGGSIIIAAGYEGVGKGAGSGAGVTLIYQINCNGSSTIGNSKLRAAEIYRFASGGR